MYQWVFLIFIYLLGSLYINTLFPYLSRMDCQLLSPFFGVGFSSLAVGFLLILSIPLSLLRLFILLIIIIYITRLTFKKTSYYVLPWSKILSGILSNVFSFTFVLYALISGLAVIVAFGYASPDSTQFEGAGRYLAQGGLAQKTTTQIAFMLNGRLLIVGAMHAINRLFNGYSLYALNPTLSIWFIIFLAFKYFYLLRNMEKFTRIILVLFFVITLALYKHVFNGMFHIHSSQLAMIFFTISIISLYLFSIGEEKIWIYIGSLAISFACLTRVDMLLCSLIFFFLLILISRTNLQTMKYSWCIFFMTLLPWRVFTYYYTPWSKWYVSGEQLSLLIGANILLCGLTFVLLKYNRAYMQVYRISPFILGPIIILIAGLLSPDKIQLGFNLFILYILLGHGSWLLFTISFIFSVISFIYVYREDMNYYILFTPITFYLLLLFLLVSFAGYEGKDHSADRMVFHIVPLFIFSLFFSLSIFINKTIKLFR